MTNEFYPLKIQLVAKLTEINVVALKIATMCAGMLDDHLEIYDIILNSLSSLKLLHSNEKPLSTTIYYRYTQCMAEWSDLITDKIEFIIYTEN